MNSFQFVCLFKFLSKSVSNFIYPVSEPLSKPSQDHSGLWKDQVSWEITRLFPSSRQTSSTNVVTIFCFSFVATIIDAVDTWPAVLILELKYVIVWHQSQWDWLLPWYSCVEMELCLHLTNDIRIRGMFDKVFDCRPQAAVHGFSFWCWSAACLSLS